MATEYLLQASVENQVTDISGTAGLNDGNGEEPDKNLKPLHYQFRDNQIQELLYSTIPIPVECQVLLRSTNTC